MDQLSAAARLSSPLRFLRHGVVPTRGSQSLIRVPGRPLERWTKTKNREIGHYRQKSIGSRTTERVKVPGSTVTAQPQVRGRGRPKPVEVK